MTYDSRKPPFTNWASNEPNDMLFSKAYANSCNGEDCVILKEWQSKTLWYDNDCENKKPFVCEKFRGLLDFLLIPLSIAIYFCYKRVVAKTFIMSLCLQYFPL